MLLNFTFYINLVFLLDGERRQFVMKKIITFIYKYILNDYYIHTSEFIF